MTKLGAWRRVGVCALAAALVIRPAAVVARQGRAVGMVSGYAPVESRHIIVRAGRSGSAGEKIPVRIGTSVEAGDEVTLPPRASLTIRLGDGSTKRMDGPGTFKVPTATGLGPLERLLSATFDILDVEFRSTRTAISRGSGSCEPSAPAAPIVAPSLRARSHVVAGPRDIPLAWSGGCAPYTVSLTRGQTSLAAETNLSQSQVRLPKVDLVAGSTYTLTIGDMRGARKTFSLEAVAAGPAPPTELAANTSPLGVIARALWLADLDDGAWRLESFEMLRPAIRSGDDLAGLIGDVLLWRDTPRLAQSIK